MVMPYHLHMPSYFLETFTEYPFVVAQEKLVMIKLRARITWISRFLLTATVKFM